MLNLKQDAMTAKQVSEQIGLSVATLATWRSRGKGPEFIRIAGRIYYLNTAVQEWLDKEIAAA
ncbi:MULTISPECIES: AlpA family transcriptional regulator [Corynebacterium]|uniref:helix-turn-helix transcriptional regulator n=1 Tax=Corynebacterium TaxID=1716 RepID=UPI0020033363|nr:MULTISPECIES: helix-turn-helix domain-containing protein [Corynebacterium]MCK6083838.1 helix-turn-helix domain-containing protein [Corynebacterium kefirresidentii]MCK6083982.1 helix-turn-helix domain-containing protein [Corynebacterium kefirresidentii]MCK6083992.1 helix-turn-helix domain-containing protein [Corynebacterium kefirresidentii]MDV2421792.1 helix-turn-helix domain-containing protein [Corynebacterium tuberculostearicum]